MLLESEIVTHHDICDAEVRADPLDFLRCGCPPDQCFHDIRRNALLQTMSHGPLASICARANTHEAVIVPASCKPGDEEQGMDPTLKRSRDSQTETQVASCSVARAIGMLRHA